MRWYQEAFAGLLAGEVDLDNGMFASLHGAAYVPAAADDFFNDATNELTTGGGYTAGGLAVTLTYAKTLANAWGVQRANSTAYNLEDVVRPAAGNGFLYRAAQAGTSGGSVPTYPTVVGQTVTDGGVIWQCVGSAIVVIGGADWTWPAFTAGPFQVVVLRDGTSGVASTSRLVGYQVLAAPTTGGGGSYTFSKNANTNGFLHAFVP